jgi:hypothetical protein
MNGVYEVTFVVNATKTRVTRKFSSPYLARKFVNKLRYSKRCTLLAYPVFD